MSKEQWRIAVFELAAAQICFTGVMIVYGGILARVAALEYARYAVRRQDERHEKNKKEKNIIFVFFVATCFTIIVFALPFYWLGASAETAFRISAIWFALSIPFGCFCGSYLQRRNNSNPLVYHMVYYGEIE